MTQPTTFRPKVDYTIRPAKATVRRMFAESLSRLSPLARVDQYRYVGMGSIFFRDFQILHRTLGISQMTTIESKKNAKVRIEFNRPLACIESVMESTSRALPKLPLEENPHIIWLDYESRLNAGVLGDIEETMIRCAPSSAIAVTVNIDHFFEDEPRERWLNQFGDETVRPEPAQPRARAEYALFSYRVMCSAISDSLRMRNAGRPDDQRLKFRQMLHLVHADNSHMLTVCGVLVRDADERRWEECDIGALEFARVGEEPFEVVVPILTRREVHYLLSKLPTTDDDFEAAATHVGIPGADARKFASIYRFAPLFIEADDW